MKYNAIYNNFASGELSRNLHGRTDLEEYFKGVAEMTNFLPIRQGGSTFRPGTVCIEAGYPVTASEIFEFSPRDSEKYAVLLQPGRPIQIFNSDGVSATITQPDYPWNRRPNFTVSTAAYHVPADDDAHKKIVDSLQKATSGDVMIVVDGTGELAPIVILRIATNTFVVDSFILPSLLNSLDAFYIYPPELPLRVPYKDKNLDTNVRLVPSAVSGTITITAQNAAAASTPFFSGDVVGMLVKITHAPTGTGVALITAKSSDSSVTAVVYEAFGGTTAQTDFEVSAWNPVDGYPKTVCFHEGRLIFGGNIKYPDTLWFSNTGNIYHFMQRRLLQDATANTSGLNYFGEVKATDPFSFIPAAVGANSIQWIFPADTLLVGTTGNEFSINGGQEATISLSSIFVKSISSHGSSKVQAVKVGSSVIFVSVDGKRVLEIPKRLVEYISAVDWTGLAAGIVEKSIDNVTSDPLTVQPLLSKITKFTWDESSGVLWCVCKNTGSSDTTLISLTVDRTSKVVAWAKHTIGGNPFITAISSIPDAANPGNSRIFMFLKRAGASAYSLESISYKNMHDSYLPSRLIVGGPPLSVFLDGSAYANTTSGVTDEISIGSDQQARFPSGASFGVIEITDNVGTYLGEYPSVAGVISIPDIDPLKSYIVGALYEGEIKTMPIEAGAQFGVSQGSPRRTHEIVAYVDRSCSGVYKASKSSNQFPIVSSKGTPSALYTGEIKLSLNASPDDTQIVIKQTEPYPFTLLWLLTKGYTYDV